MGKKEKKEKTKKEKNIYLDQANYSNNYKEFLNNQKYSDYTIKFEGSEETMAVHKIVLSQSEVLSEIVETTTEYIFSKEFEISTVKKFIKYLYTGTFDISEKETVFSFVLITNKVYLIFLKTVQSK
jgi:hypothetical protein